MNIKFWHYKVVCFFLPGMSPQAASQSALDHMTRRVGGSGGVVVVSKTGEVAATFTTERMAWAWVKDGQLHYGLDPGQQLKWIIIYSLYKVYEVKPRFHQSNRSKDRNGWNTCIYFSISSLPLKKNPVYLMYQCRTELMHEFEITKTCLLII
jgi:hypothetical protein